MEIAAFVLIGKQIGALATIALVVASTMAGSLLLRHRGLGTIDKVRAVMEKGEDPGPQLAAGAMAVVAALLLIVPGFITSTIGLLVLLPPVRALFWRLVGRRVVFTGQTGASGFGRGRKERAIDLDSGDFRREDGESKQGGGSSPWRRLSED